jgi:hypothetical protein
MRESRIPSSKVKSIINQNPEMVRTRINVRFATV